METLTKESAGEIMRTKGETRGLNLKSDGDFVLKEKGGKGLLMLEIRMEELGYPIKYMKVRGMDFYPIGYKALTLKLIDELFDFSDEKLVEMGEFQAKLPLVIRIFMGSFFSLERVIKDLDELWHKYYTVGSVKIAEFHKNEKWGIVKISGLPLPAIYFKTLDGFFPKMVQIIVKKPVSRETLKAPYKGDSDYEIKLSW